MDYKNEMRLVLRAKSENESLARVCVAAFAAQLDPVLSDLSDIKTAVSEAVTNAIIHGYNGREQKGQVYIRCGLLERTLYIEIKDEGVGIADIEEAMTPLYTSKPEMERSGMGFTVMQEFMDAVSVVSVPGKGTTVHMQKKLLKVNEA